MKRIFTCFAFLACFAVGAHAGQTQVAVAANFTAPMKQIAEAFQKDTGHSAELTFGSTGKLYAQIKNGAPFDILLSADEKTPARLVEEGAGVAGSNFPYAIGTLVLYSAQPDLVDAEGKVLQNGKFAHLAIADARNAPYGAAAEAVLRALGLYETLQPRFVTGENIGQTYQFVASGNAALGFVALSQIMEGGKVSKGSYWQPAADLYPAIRQDAVLLKRAESNEAARALLDYLRGARAHAIMRDFGYAIPE
ncbi:MAG: molybdate ABC transporter substrate-binding protein [Rhodocyclaceae bacterium]|nr:molybdate ABC transporter substrate-binding protein [Rhodocyclaceae bacterium]